jgi:hypothetical protein
MRGKLVVMSLFVMAALLFGYSLWFVNNHSPVDKRFNMRRKPLADDTAGALILKERAGDFLRSGLTVDTLDATEGRRHGIATYDVEGKTVTLEVERFETTPTLEMAFADFLSRAGGEARFSTLTLHPEAQLPYGYAVFAGLEYTYYEFSWINGNWILRVSTRDAGAEALLRFANGYTF